MIALVQGTGWIEAAAALLGVAIASVALLLARSRPILPALAGWAALALCVALQLLPTGVAVLLGAALAAALMADRLPAGLAWALFAWLVNLAAAWTLADAAVTATRGVSFAAVVTQAAGMTPVATTFLLEVISHTAAVLCFWWMLAAWLCRREGGGWAGDARSAFLMTSIVLGVASIVILVYAAVIVAIWLLRQIFVLPPVYVYRTAWQGLIDVLFLALALAVSRGVGRWAGRPVAGLWLAIFAGTWWGLMLPPGSDLTLRFWPGWLVWTAWAQTAWAWSLLIAVLVWTWSDWRSQERAWPYRLDQLARASRPWRGLTASATWIGLGLIPVGLWHALAAGPGAARVSLLTALDMAAVALGLSVLAGRHWNRAAGELALAIWTVGFAASGAAMAAAVADHHTSLESLPVIQTGALAGLAVGSLFWYWMASVWHQQIEGVRAWTTTGRMVPLAGRVGFMAAALGVLVGTKLALWPQLPYATADDSLVRLVCMSTVYAVLVGTCLYGWRVTGNAAPAVLAVLVGVTWMLFLWLRV